MANLAEPADETIRAWTAVQERIAGQIIQHDDVRWRVDDEGRPVGNRTSLLCAGADVSFAVLDPSAAVATLTVVKLSAAGDVKLVYSASKYFTITVPYAPNFLAFRESPLVVQMLQNVPEQLRGNIDVLLLDGNGELHPRRAGLACHVAVEAGGLPTIGVAKTLMCIDGLVERDVRRDVLSLDRGSFFPVVGQSGKTWAHAILTGNAVSKPLYVSVGHRVSLHTATKIVRALCVYRVPEPIRAADFHSREALRGQQVDIPYAAQSE